MNLQLYFLLVIYYCVILQAKLINLSKSYNRKIFLIVFTVDKVFLFFDKVGGRIRQGKDFSLLG
jgi:hypothetical protein